MRARIKTYKCKYWALALLCCCLLSCKKYLDKVPDSRLAVPATLEEFQQLLDNELMFTNNSPALGEFSSDDIYLPYTAWQAALPVVRNAYIWEKDIYKGQANTDWNNLYTQVYYANIVLEGVRDLTVSSGNQAKYNVIKSSALFHRAYAFYNLLETYSKPYDAATAASDLGIPLRVSADLNEKAVRSSVQASYDRLIQDIQDAIHTLPTAIPFGNLNRPSKPVAFALLARVYLSMQDYQKAGQYADSSLQLYRELTDFNTLNVSTTLPFAGLINEVMYQSTEAYYNIFFYPVDTTLYSLYDENDIRREIFFRNNAATGIKEFKGSYSTSIFLFSGFATDEMYLIRAECSARNGNVTAAMSDLNELLEKRWKTGAFVPFTAATPDEALGKILVERRKELVFRGLRWSDLRRLNRQNASAISLTRVLDGNTVTLPPNDLRYTFPIPDNEIRLSGIQQNPR
jgi:tetratricopeptide (TPR) repeat protein